MVALEKDKVPQKSKKRQNTCLLSPIAGNSEIFAQLFNQLVQDGVIEKPVFKYGFTTAGWHATMKFNVVATKREYSAHSEFEKTKLAAKHSVLADLAHVLPMLTKLFGKHNLTFKRKRVAILCDEGEIMYCSP